MKKFIGFLFLLYLLLFPVLLPFLFPGLLAAEMPITRIIGGEESNPDQFPGTVALLVKSAADPYQGQFCGGSLIAPDWVMTAAHCAILNPEDMTVYYGSNDLIGLGGISGVKRIIVHEKYEKAGPQDYDIALIELSSPIDNPLLPVSRLPALNGERLTVAGWGAMANDDAGSHTFPTKLRHVTVPVVSQEAMKQVYPHATDQMFAAGLPEGGQDSCQGDSGGPIMREVDGKYMQVGIVSFGQLCAKPGLWGVYARTDNLYPWIASRMMGIELLDQEEDEESDTPPIAGAILPFYLLSMLFILIANYRFHNAHK